MCKVRRVGYFCGGCGAIVVQGSETLEMCFDGAQGRPCYREYLQDDFKGQNQKKGQTRCETCLAARSERYRENRNFYKRQMRAEAREAQKTQETIYGDAQRLSLQGMYRPIRPAPVINQYPAAYPDADQAQRADPWHQTNYVSDPAADRRESTVAASSQASSHDSQYSTSTQETFSSHASDATENQEAYDAGDRRESDSAWSQASGTDSVYLTTGQDYDQNDVAEVAETPGVILNPPPYHAGLNVDAFNENNFRTYNPNALFHRPQNGTQLPIEYTPEWYPEDYAPEPPGDDAPLEQHYVWGSYWVYVHNLGYQTPEGFLEGYDQWYNAYATVIGDLSRTLYG